MSTWKNSEIMHLYRFFLCVSNFKKKHLPCKSKHAELRNIINWGYLSKGLSFAQDNRISRFFIYIGKRMIVRFLVICCFVWSVSLMPKYLLRGNINSFVYVICFLVCFWRRRAMKWLNFFMTPVARTWLGTIDRTKLKECFGTRRNM